ncbi:PadR family transcriptional regulator [Clostridium estertheticum]|uniref:PadR family transcriptional regulator n=1 Tax=Clostridium estertheticum TaxID=238834 RepID=A0AA47EFD9_9CLOT|nr:PadR family transcriptional regulator [Clostridium estertheticum]MBU3155718.1 PadR family transcriptional regulator [Clostridium estertheticum]MBU3201197.1 PadR family transcriptional regulator [Clostridium estertheticum]WAG59070.1 PadR family transcriptional regulator [Clostridium estertheticum]WAG66879.1 PadR family transcriptional regulator [Clostridium estertheticum]
MRTLKYAILGLINRKPLTGYDITKEFNSGLVEFWYANHSQIYPELRKLTDECLISYKIIIQGEKLEKKLYTITEEGKVCLQKWLKKDEPLENTPKDVFRLKAYFCDEISNEDLVKQFQSALNKHFKRLEYLENTMKELLKINDISKVSSPRFGDYIVLNGAIMREKAYIEWIEDCIKKILCK